MFQALLHIQKLSFKIKEDVNMIENSIENMYMTAATTFDSGNFFTKDIKDIEMFSN